jgi:hypothetical protein
MFEKLFHDLVTLFVVVNPIGVVPLFLAVAGRESAAARRRIAAQAIIISAVILLVFIAIGQLVLEALGIDLASFRIAGGLVLLVIALRMVLAETETSSDTSQQRRRPLRHEDAGRGRLRSQWPSASAARRASVIRSLAWQQARRSRKSLWHAKALAQTMSAWPCATQAGWPH